MADYTQTKMQTQKELVKHHLLSTKLHKSQIQNFVNHLIFSAPSLLVWLDTFVRPILNVEMIEEPFDWRMYHSLPHGTCFKTSILINPIKYYTHSKSLQHLSV